MSHNFAAPGTSRPTSTPAVPEAGTTVGLGGILAVGIGNALEFYDFLTFSFFSIQIGHSFFPEAQGSHGLLYALATFGVGFAMRPLGGFVIGRLGDRAGRKPAMLLSFSLMGFAILGVVLTPSYARIGIAAPLLLVFFRLVQGFALGGQVGPSTAYLVEAAPPRRRGLYVAVQNCTADLAVLFAGVVGYVLSRQLSPADLDDWGWRLAFLIGVAVVPFGLWMRRNLPETAPPPPKEALAADESRVTVRIVALGLCMLAAGTISGYVLDYLTTYAQDSLKMSVRLAFVATMVVGLFQAGTDLFAGWLADRYGRRPVMLTAVGVQVLLTVPLFFAMNHVASVELAFVAMGVLAVFNALATVPMLVIITESLPRAARSGTLSMMYACAIAVFGGSTQFAVQYLTNASGSTLAPAWYMTLALLVGGTAGLLSRETRPRATGSGSVTPVEGARSGAAPPHQR